MLPSTLTVGSLILIIFVQYLKCDANIIENESVNTFFTSSDSLVKFSLLYGIFNEIKNNDDNSDCGRDVQAILDGISARELWAIKLLDTSTNIPPSFVFGNNFWFSPSHLCTDLNNGVSISLSNSIPKLMKSNLMNDTSPIYLIHRMVYANYTSQLQIDIQYHIKKIIHIGLCVPASCSEQTITRLTETYLNGNSSPLIDLLEIKQINIIGSKITGFNINVFAQNVFYLLSAIVIINILMPIISWLWTKGDNKKPIQAKNTEDNDVLSSESNVFSRILNCFNLEKNYEQIMRTKQSSKTLGSVTGLRTIACFWIIIFHVCYHASYSFDNLSELFVKMDYLAFQPIFQAYLYVDTFFVLSAILLVYNFLDNKETQQTIQLNDLWQNTKFFGKHLVHRYIRLTPILIITMVISEALSTYMEECSPFWVDESHDLWCRENWWQNLLYIQNFYGVSTMCVSWTWYLACDMQFYLIVLLGLFIYVKNENHGKIIYILMTITSIVLSFYLYYIYNSTYEVDMLEKTIDHLYIRPWTRMNPYLSGVLMGWILYQCKDKTIEVGSYLVKIFWLLCTIIFIGSLFMSYKRDIPSELFALIHSAGKFAFGIFIGAIILMCNLGYGGFLNNILSHGRFIHLNKLTYSMYMLSPLVIIAGSGLKEVSSHFDETSTFINMIAAIVVSYWASVIAAVLIEIPFQKISEEFILKRKKVQK